MGIFVRVQNAETERQDVQVSVYEIRQATFTAGLVSDYALFECAGGEQVSQIKGYPRYTETGLTLFLRMLKDAPRHVLSGPAAGRIAVSLRIGDDPSQALERELLHFTVEGTLLVVDLLSPAALVAGKRVAVGPMSNIREAICQAMRSALGWGELQPVPPKPLSDVPIRRTPSGSEYINLSDVPPLPRQYLRLHLCRSLADQRIRAPLWRAFLRRCIGGWDETERVEGRGAPNAAGMAP